MNIRRQLLSLVLLGGAALSMAGTVTPTYALYANADTKRDTIWQINADGSMTKLFNLDKVGPTGGASVAIGAYTNPAFPGQTLIGVAEINPITGNLVISGYLQDGTSIGSTTLMTDVATWHVVGFGDFDGDSNPDLITWNPGDNTYTAFTTTGTYSLDVTGVDEGFFFTPVAVGDENSDGSPDILVVEPSTNKARWLFFNGTTAGLQGATINPHDDGRTIVGAADVDGNGFMDIFSRKAVFIPGTPFNGTYDTRLTFYSGNRVITGYVRIMGDRQKILLAVGQ